MIWQERLKFIKDINKMLIRVAKSIDESPKELENSTWGELLATMQVAMEMQQDDNPKGSKVQPRLKSKK